MAMDSSLECQRTFSKDKWLDRWAEVVEAGEEGYVDIFLACLGLAEMDADLSLQR